MNADLITVFPSLKSRSGIRLKKFNFNWPAAILAIVLYFPISVPVNSGIGFMIIKFSRSFDYYNKLIRFLSYLCTLNPDYPKSILSCYVIFSGFIQDNY